MGERLKYVRRANQAVAAVQLSLETDGFSYRKWGGVQRCKAGDWLIDNDGDVYTVDRQVFARTYRKSAVGAYLKITPIWAEEASEDGSVRTKEGETQYRSGDYLVFNEENGGDAYAMQAGKFKAMYERVE